jgi:hypothetical protein
MAIPVALRVDFKASQLRGLARKTKDGPQARRLLALAAIYDGATRTEAALVFTCVQPYDVPLYRNLLRSHDPLRRLRRDGIESQVHCPFKLIEAGD